MPVIRDPDGAGPRADLEGVVPRARVVTWPTVVAFGSLAVPFGIVLIRFLATSASHVYLPDDLALIDLHTRLALGWHQQLGPFDRFGWNHPGPSYYYLLTIPYRLLGSGVRAEFFGATLINALAAVGCVAVVRRRGTPVQAVWAAVCVGVLAIQLSFVGPGNVTYSESALGALVSPWNPTVVILPLVLVALLCASAAARSPLSLVGALLVGSFVVQTDISTAPLVASLLVAATAVIVTRAVRRRRTAGTAPGDRAGPGPGRWWAAAGLVLLLVMWAPPVIQQISGHPGNLTLIARFFTSGRPGQSIHTALWAVATVDGMLVHGPSGVMNAWIVGAPRHAGAAVLVAAATILVAILTTVGGVVRRNHFATGLGALSLVGMAASVVAIAHITGPVYGYLVVWEIASPMLALVGIGILVLSLPVVDRAFGSSDRRPETLAADRWRRLVGDAGAAPLQFVLPAVAVLVGVVLAARMLVLPPLSAASDPAVGSLVRLVAPSIDRRDAVLVGVTGPDLIRVEEFIGLVNQLDIRGYHPRVSSFWKVQFGPRFLATGHEPVRVTLLPWSASAIRLPGFVGRVTDTAVTITGPGTAAPAG